MTASSFVPRFSLVVEARNALDRRGAVAILREDLGVGPPTGEFWRNTSLMCAQLGEHSLSIEAARRFAATQPRDMDHVFFYATMLARNNRLQEALDQLNPLPATARNHPVILHFRGHSLTQLGDFAGAEATLRKAIAISPAPVQWLALSVAKKFVAGDPDIAHMESVLARIGNAPPDVRAQLHYALGKAYDDAGDKSRAANAYAAGADLMRRMSSLPGAGMPDAFASHLVAGYTQEAMAKLQPSRADGSRVLFVTGFPRSGTTLVEQILASHSAVVGGSEFNLAPVALIPASNAGAALPDSSPSPDMPSKYEATADFTFADAMAYQTRIASNDPWGDIGRDYLKMVEERFGPDGLAIDKTLNLGSFMGLMLHSLPKARVFWLRRRPEDCALSNYRLYSSPGTLPWTNSAADIAEFFKAEDKLYAHWTKMFPDRIMTVPYEELVSDPQTWIRRILAHAGLPEEPAVFEPHKSTRAVTTASMAQVRAPISTARIGASEAYKDFTEAFRRAYYGA